MVYVATDEKDLSLFEPFHKHVRVKFMSDYYDRAGVSELNPNLLGMLDQVRCNCIDSFYVVLCFACSLVGVVGIIVFRAMTFRTLLGSFGFGLVQPTGGIFRVFTPAIVAENGYAHVQGGTRPNEIYAAEVSRSSPVPSFPKWPLCAVSPPALLPDLRPLSCFAAIPGAACRRWPHCLGRSNPS